MTIRVPLERLVQRARRSRALLAGEANRAYVDRELEIVESIKRGLVDVVASRVVAHEQVGAKARHMVEHAKAART